MRCPSRLGSTFPRWNVRSTGRSAAARTSPPCGAESEAAKVGTKLAGNQRAPKVNLRTFVAKDLGDGPAELRPVEWGAGVMLEMPLPLREARGGYRAAKAELAAVDASMRGLKDRVGAEVRSAVVALRAAEQSVTLAGQQVGAAYELADAERTRFAEGASELVIVNLREIQAADAAMQEIDARADYQRAHADYMVATGRSPVP